MGALRSDAALSGRTARPRHAPGAAAVTGQPASVGRHRAPPLGLFPRK